MSKEIWKDVVGYEGLYEVSSFGRVKSFKRGREKVLKNLIGHKGYLSVNLYLNKVMKGHYVHKLIVMAFLGHKPDGTMRICTDHIDNDSLNNRLENLQLVSSRVNSTKDIKIGSSKYVGVHFDKTRWRARIHVNGKAINLGSFKKELEAAQAYQDALKELVA